MNKYLERDWDVLIILDACRYDVFNSVVSSVLDGKLSVFDSEATCTPFWYKTHWNSENNIILVSANPQPWWEGSNYSAKNFIRSRQAWEDNSVENTINHALEMIKMFNNRFLIHCLPPHLPFNTGNGKSFMQKVFGNKKIRGREMYLKIQEYCQNNGWDELYSAYEVEVINALIEIKKVLPKFKDKKIVITSDHGELLGENGLYDHPSNPKSDKLETILRTVPWYEIRY